MIKIINLLPELLGTYGDQGNVATLSWRLSQRGIENQIIHASAYHSLPTDGDFYLLGGGEDDAQVAAVELLRRENVLQRALDNGAQIFAVCAGFQLLGSSFPASGGRIIAGLGLLPIVTEPATPRSVGELLVDSTIGIGQLTGFENHAGQTKFVEKLQPLGITKRGIGNHAMEACDGAVTDQIIATYMHGPALVRNPKLADYFLGRKVSALAPIKDDSVFTELHASCVARAAK
ncbi:MAG: type 1 glutamine amidotransferase [Candidatus Nanopelagicaceae bacterium]